MFSDILTNLKSFCKWDLLKTQSLCIAKEINQKTTDWEKIFANDVTDKGKSPKSTDSS